MNKLMKKYRQIKQKKEGFTLVELIVVLVILAILAAILVPALLGWIDKAKEKQYVLEARNVYMAAQTKLSEVYAGKGISEVNNAGGAVGAQTAIVGYLNGDVDDHAVLDDILDMSEVSLSGSAYDLFQSVTIEGISDVNNHDRYTLTGMVIKFKSSDDKTVTATLDSITGTWSISTN